MIKERLRPARQMLRSAAKNGFFHIFVSGTLVKIIGMFPSLLLNVILVKAALANIALPTTNTSYLVMFSGLGIAGGILRYCAIAETESDVKGYFLFGLRFGLLSNVVLGMLASVVYLLLPFPAKYPLYRPVSIILSATPLFAFGLDAIQYFFRATKENRYYSRIAVVFAACMSFLQLFLAVLWNVAGIVAGRYLSYVVAILSGLLLLRHMAVLRAPATKLTFAQKADMVKYSIGSMFASCFSQMIGSNEQTIVNVVIMNNDVTAGYSFASTLPAAMQFVANSIVIFVFPYFAKKYRDGGWILKNTLRTCVLTTAITLLYTVPAFVFTPQIITIYNRSYLDPGTIHIMRLLWVAFGIANCLRIPLGNILAAIGEIRFNTLNNALSMLLHLYIGTRFVQSFGVNGAAFGIMIIYGLSSVSSLIFLVIYCKRLQKQAQMAG